ncbi:MAG TPA: nicotinate-nucleotide adenylyltransferase [Gemmatimonadales bacterium]|nr:nicotinate-nucleotide adenylyltransferase [Gemmatimonadales bacterium]
MRIGVFGGSFDPIHHGHLIAAASLAESLELEEVRLVVARRQPLKPAGHAAAAEDRAAMVELAVRKDPQLRSDRRELQREEPSYMVDTLRTLHAERPDAELVLLLGADAATRLDQWREPEEIGKLCRVETFVREGIGEAGIQVPRVDISSTAIRARVRAGRSIRYWVPDAVVEYIAARRLYEEAQER